MKVTISLASLALFLTFAAESCPGLEPVDEERLAVTPAAGLSPSRALTVVVVRSDLLTVLDRREGVELPSLTVPLESRTFEGSGVSVNPRLLAALETFLEADKARASLRRVHFSGALGLEIDARAPFGLIVEVLYTAGQAGYSTFDFLVDTPDGLRVIPHRAPHIGCTGPDEGDPPCSTVRAHLVSRGLMVRAVPRFNPPRVMAVGKTLSEEELDEMAEILSPVRSSESAPFIVGHGSGWPEALDGLERDEPRTRSEEGPPASAAASEASKEQGAGRAGVEGVPDESGPAEVGGGAGSRLLEALSVTALPGGLGGGSGGQNGEGMARDRSWENATVLARPGSCPSVPLRGGKDDLSAFIHLVERVLDLAPSCRISEVSALGQTPWHRLASTMQGLQSQGLDVFFVMGEAGYGVEACQGARIPEAYFASD